MQMDFFGFYARPLRTAEPRRRQVPFAGAKHPSHRVGEDGKRLVPRWFLSRLRKEFARSALRHVRWSSGQGPNAPFFSESGEFKLAGRSEIGRNATMRKGVGKSGGFKVLLLINTQRLSADFMFKNCCPHFASAEPEQTLLGEFATRSDIASPAFSATYSR